MNDIRANGIVGIVQVGDDDKDCIHNIVKESLWKDYTTNYKGFMTFEEYNNKLF